MRGCFHPHGLEPNRQHNQRTNKKASVQRKKKIRGGISGLTTHVPQLAMRGVSQHAPWVGHSRRLCIVGPWLSYGL
eukprot:12919659-Prorocentrum_lima.AAC.1